jgi:hypothetical protein
LFGQFGPVSSQELAQSRKQMYALKR